MTDAVTPVAHPRRRSERRSTADRLARRVVAAAVVVAAVAVAIDNLPFRTAEAAAVARVLIPLVVLRRGDAARVHSSGDMVILPVAPHVVEGFRITVECTSLVILVPLLVVGAVMLAFSTLRWWRFAVAMASMAAVVLVVNLARVGLVCLGTRLWGPAHFVLLHTFVGSVIGIIGFAAGVAVLVVVMGARVPFLGRGAR